MNIKRFLGGVLFAAMLLCSEGTMGQTVTQITSANYSSLGVSSSYVDCWLLDCSMIEADRLASGSLTAYDDVALPDGGLTSNNYSSWSNQFYTHDETNSTINRVYPKLIISDVDLDYEGNTTESWYNMVNAVKESTYKGATGWRLPTQRELMLMWIMSQNNSSFTFTNGNYWTAMSIEGYNIYAIYISFGGGSTSYAKSTSLYARAVKEL